MVGTLPEVLRDYYKELGKEPFNYEQDKLLRPDEIFETEEYVVFYAENQWVVVWAIRKEDMNKNDPPIYCSYDYEEGEFELEAESLHYFLNSIALLQGAFYLEYTIGEFINIEEKQAKKIRAAFQKKEYYLRKWIGVEFYGNNADSVIGIFQNDGYYNLMYSSSNQKHFEEIDEYIEKEIIENNG